jgi:hypothetical protein
VHQVQGPPDPQQLLPDQLPQRHQAATAVGSNSQENKRNECRKVAVEDKAPKIQLLPSAFTAMVSPEMLASAGFNFAATEQEEDAEEDEDLQFTEV